MTPGEWITLIGLLLTFGLGVFNFVRDTTRGRSIGMLERGNYLESVNKSVKLANDRALEAEKRADDLEKRLGILESNLTYRLTFDVLLGAQPKVERVSIERFENVTP